MIVTTVATGTAVVGITAAATTTVTMEATTTDIIIITATTDRCADCCVTFDLE